MNGAPPQVFPAVQRHSNELKQAAAAVIEQTDQEDLRTMANAYASTLDAGIKKAGRCTVGLLFHGAYLGFRVLTLNPGGG